MRRALGLVLVSALFAGSASAQDSGPIPEAQPLLARYVLASGALAVGGGPEADAIAAAASGLSPRIVGPSGAMPLLTQGTIALAVIPREMTVIERAAVRRFSGGLPLAVPVMQGLYLYARCNKDGAVDERLRPVLQALLSDGGQARLKVALAMYKPLDAAALADARDKLASLHGITIPQRRPGYLAPDGSLSIIGSDTLTTIMPEMLSAYARHAPKVRFTADLRGSSTAMPALAAGTTIFAPMGRELWQNDLDGFRQVKGYDPVRIRVAYASHGPRTDGKTPPAIYVNARNPLAGMSMAQVQRVFAAGAPGGDIADWSALGGAAGAIHVYGARDDGGFGSAMRASKLDGLPFSARYQAMPSGKAILAAVAADPLGIGYATWIDAGDAPAGVRVLPLSAHDGGPYVLPLAGADRGAWPISYFLNIYVDKAPGRPIAPAAKDLLRFLLSDEGQAIIARHTEEEDGYVPLDLHDLVAERAIAEGL
ncbi:ABC-type phosphate transport system, substrate-binding protein [Sphingobium sp. AP50]|uniref:PstS family phosphate ABC transporter substrate-binding protein n=1 Tax=Sphingobium sp. AP50 TaxID=1884369 RepID=UPI0008CCC75E|nr:substrate-binding domain-containing protein [Sphingobium sp. AP50]SEI69667.1 ABC-type phosphate transport system, substrate-binding protein [Sphingobium sp. AP50]